MNSDQKMSVMGPTGVSNNVRAQSKPFSYHQLLVRWWSVSRNGQGKEEHYGHTVRPFFLTMGHWIEGLGRNCPITVIQENIQFQLLVMAVIIISPKSGQNV